MVFLLMGLVGIHWRQFRQGMFVRCENVKRDKKNSFRLKLFLLHADKSNLKSQAEIFFSFPLSFLNSIVSNRMQHRVFMFLFEFGDDGFDFVFQVVGFGELCRGKKRREI